MTALIRGVALLLALAAGALWSVPESRGRSEDVPYAYRSGYGTVEHVTRVEMGGTAAAGGTAGRVVDGIAYRLTVRMDDRTVQTVLQDSPSFSIGDRVHLTEDGRVSRLSSSGAR
ncbi:MAG TPA: hypothetical protein VFC18_08275 [Burkholderiales bacterium]|nr:hypothetical protein [Burkholderiales bacterium]